jgi:hypothetical protein
VAQAAEGTPTSYNRKLVSKPCHVRSDEPLGASHPLTVRVKRTLPNQLAPVCTVEKQHRYTAVFVSQCVLLRGSCLTW